MLSVVRNRITAQFIATAGALLLINQTGLVDGWTSPNLARLTSSNTSLSLSLSEASWLVSSFQLGRFASVILVPIFIESAGSRKTILYTFIPVSISWLVMIFANSAMWLYLAKFLSGITDGLAYGCYSIFLGEISSPKYRGTSTSIAMIGWPLGSLIATIGETYLPINISSVIYLLPCLVGITLFACLPESPYQLVKNQKIKEASESLTWYRGHEDNDMEMKDIIEYIESTNKTTITDKLRQLSKPAIKKSIILVAVLNAFPDFCGVFNIIFYMQIILTTGESSLVKPSEVVVYTNIIQLFLTIIGVKLMDALGRRILLLTSSIGMTIGMIGLGLHYHLQPNSQTLSIISVILFVMSFTIGFSPVPSTLVGEMFPSSMKSTAATTASFATASIGFLSTKAYQPLIDAIGETYVFWMYACLMATAVPVVLFLLPETKGKSLQEIQNDLNKK